MFWNIVKAGLPIVTGLVANAIGNAVKKSESPLEPIVKPAIDAYKENIEPVVMSLIPSDDYSSTSSSSSSEDRPLSLIERATIFQEHKAEEERKARLEEERQSYCEIAREVEEYPPQSEVMYDAATERWEAECEARRERDRLARIEFARKKEAERQACLEAVRRIEEERKQRELEQANKSKTQPLSFINGDQPIRFIPTDRCLDMYFDTF